MRPELRETRTAMDNLIRKFKKINFPKLESSQVLTLVSNEVKWPGLWFTFHLRDEPSSSPDTM